MNIFISNLSFRINDDDLKQLFEDYGQISSAKVINDKYTGKSRGFGFVEMPNDDEAKKAIEELDRAEYDGKIIAVSKAKPKTESTGRSYDQNNRNKGGGGYNKKW
jgi:RNA recognition motif-containing protein